VRVFRDFFRDDLVRVAATIADFTKQRRFKSTIVDNTNYQREIGGRPVARLYEDDLELVVRLAEAAAIALEEVPG
jgi:hypothetical protein